MNPTGEWQEYSRLVMGTLERLENEIKSLKERRDADKQEFLQAFEDIRKEFVKEIDKIRNEFRDKEIERLEANLAEAEARIKAQEERIREKAEKVKEENPDTELVKEEIIRDHKVDNFFANRTRLYWAMLAGGVGTLWAVVEFIIEPLIKAAAGG